MYAGATFSMEVKTETRGNDVTECLHVGKPPGMFPF